MMGNNLAVWDVLACNNQNLWMFQSNIKLDRTIGRRGKNTYTDLLQNTDKLSVALSVNLSQIDMLEFAFLCLLISS